MRISYWIGWHLARLILWLMYRHRVYGVDHTAIEGGALIAPNHLSYMDPPLVGASWPHELAYLARDTLFESRVFGWLIRKLNAHPVQMGSHNLATIKMIGHLLKEGQQVVLFPEGERSFSGDLGEMKEGIGMLALRFNCPVVPTYLAGTYDLWPRTRTYPRWRGRTACVFGTPVDPEDYAHLPKREAQVAIAEEVGRRIHALKAWYEAGAAGPVP